MAYSGLRIRGAIYKMPPLTEEQKQKEREYNKRYREANKEKILEYKKQYREANKEKIQEYREANKEKAREQRKQYREANKEKIQEKKRIDRQRKKTCECGCEVFARHYARHTRTIKHEQLMNAS